MRKGFFTSKAKAQEYAERKNKHSRTLVYKVARVSYHGKPGFEKVQDGYEIVITHKR
jgi:hypothetical protein